MAIQFKSATGFDYVSAATPLPVTIAGGGSSQITTVGALTSGSIASGFGAINIGANALTAGAGSFSDDISIAAGKFLKFSATAYMAPEDNVQGARITTTGGIILNAGAAASTLLKFNDVTAATFSSTGLSVTGTGAFSGLVSVGGSTPASAAAAGVAGAITWDASYIYVCTATNTWKRVAIATW